MTPDFLSKIELRGLTFDDVLMIPAESSVVPSEVQLSTFVSTQLGLSLPILSSAMDTVTEFRLATQLARLGGIGIIHKNMAIEEQAEQVAAVKRSEAGIVCEPHALTADATVGDARRLMLDKHVSGLPILRGQKLMGLFTARDLRSANSDHQLVTELMTSFERLTTITVAGRVEQVTEALASEATRLMHTHRIEKLPLVSTDGTFQGLITLRDLRNRREYPNATKDTRGRLCVGAAVGVNERDISDRTDALVAAGIDLLVVDTAHGHSRGVIEAVRTIKKGTVQQ